MHVAPICNPLTLGMPPEEFGLPSRRLVLSKQECATLRRAAATLEKIREIIEEHPDDGVAVDEALAANTCSEWADRRGLDF